MALIRGPFDLKWGANTLTDVEEISADYSVDSQDYTTVDFRKYTIETAQDASVSLTLLGTDIPSLAAILPQYFVANGEVLSSGETVNDTDGAIDIVAASCDTNPVYNNLDIISCEDPGQVTRLVNARTVIDSWEIADNAVRKVVVKFISEPTAGVANVQFFKEGTISDIS